MLTCISASTQTVRINEFMAINSSTLMDKNGDYSDWIELYNPTASTVNLQGWSLTDNAADPRKWFFPDVTINPSSYLVLFASGKEVYEPSELHTNFKLDGDGEYLTLIDADGRILSEFAPEFPPQSADVSSAWLDGDYVKTATPTPGEENSFDSATQLNPPTFSQKRGFYQTPFAVMLASSVNNADIYFTTDGSEPTRQSTRYTSPIQINTTTVLRAVAVSDVLSSAPVTHTYIFIEDVLRQPNDPPGYPAEWGPYTAIPGTAIADYEMDPDIVDDPRYAPCLEEALLSIPTLSLVTRKENLFSHSADPDEGGIYIYTGPPESGEVPGLGGGWERPASIEFFTPDGSEEFHVNCGLRLQGGHSRRPEKSPKHSFRLVFKEKYGPKRLNYPLFGPDAVRDFNTITLRAGFGNKWIHWSHAERVRGQYARDGWAKDTQLDMGHSAGHGRYVHLYINGLYWGIYQPNERLDREFAESYLGGDESDYDVIKDYTSVVDGNITAWNEMMTLANRGLASTQAYHRIQGNNPDGTPNPNYPAYVDVVNLIDYMLLNFYGGNTDWDHHNWVAMRNRVNPGTGFQFFSWDAEHILKSQNENVTNENNNDCPSALFQRLAENADFRRLVADRAQLHCFNGGALTPDANEARWMNRANQIELAVIAESARWGDYRRDVHPYQAQGPFDLYDNDYWLDELAYLRENYFPTRTNTLISQLRAAGLFPNVAAPTFRLNGQPPERSTIEPGDVLSLAAAGSIYYTTDGSDPLLSSSSSTGSQFVLFEENAPKRAFVPKSDVGTDWRRYTSFDDSAWRLSRGAPGGVGYENGSGYENWILLDMINDMRNGATPNTSCYVRWVFDVSPEQLSKIKSLTLSVRYDDGFVAYLNGTRMAESNAPASLSWNSNAPDDHEATGLEAFDASRFVELLKEGENLLAIHALNRATNSSDFIINAELSGSDKDNSGTVSPTANLYTEPLELAHSTHIKARTLLGAEWSAMNEMMLVLPSDLYNVRFTEIHYHPAVEDTIENRSFEFLEIKNVGPAPIDMSGLFFLQGISYTFPEKTIVNPQAFLVLASHAPSFLQRYGFSSFDTYDGFLANNGEVLALTNMSGDTLAFLHYNDKSPWPEAADGGGYSLVPTDVNPLANQNDAALWRASLDIHGSPGRDDTPNSGIAEEFEFPRQFTLKNYPNPFNPVTTLSYAIPKRAHVSLTIYDILGREITKLVNDVQDANHYNLQFDARHLSSGVYFYRLRVNGKIVKTRKMLLVR